MPSGGGSLCEGLSQECSPLKVHRGIGCAVHRSQGGAAAPRQLVLLASPSTAGCWREMLCWCATPGRAHNEVGMMGRPGKLGLPLPAGATLRVLPLVTKTGQAQRASHPFACAWARVTSVRGQPAFALLGADLATVSIPVHWVSWLLVPLHPWEHTHGVACNVTCAAFNARLQTHLTSMGVWEGETSHSFRRGSLQADIAAAGHSPAEAVQHGQIRSDNTTYLHRGRHAKRARVALPCFVDVASLAPLQVSSSSPAPPPLAGVVQRPPGAGPPPACPCHALQYAHWCCSDLLLLLGPTRPCSGACR